MLYRDGRESLETAAIRNSRYISISLCTVLLLPARDKDTGQLAEHASVAVPFESDGTKMVNKRDRRTRIWRNRKSGVYALARRDRGKFKRGAR